MMVITSNNMQRLLIQALDMIVARLPKVWLAAIMRRIGAKLDVTSCICKGDLGFFEGSLSDKVVFHYYLAHHTWEPSIQDLLHHRIFRKNVGTLIDVGANIGMTAIPLKTLRPGVKIVAIEADRENFSFLKANFARNIEMKDVTLFNIAAFSEDTEVDFERSPINAGDHRIRLGISDERSDRYDESSREIIKVVARRLDGSIVADQLIHPITLKCDVQGGEIHVLRGAEKLLKEVDFVIIEFWPYGLRRTGASPDALFTLLSDFRYGLILDEDARRPAGFILFENLIERLRELISDESNTDHRELLLARNQNLFQED
jgi:FkbM family methyltransferase